MKAIDRFYEYLAEKSLRPTSVEKEIGLSNGYLSAQKKRNADMGESVILKIIDYFRDINPMWLLMGEGDMLKDINSSLVDIPKTIPVDNIPDKPVAIPAAHPNEGIPLIPIEAMAGALTSEQTILEYECERYVIPMFKGADFLIPVKGSSMHPKYSSGDIVACQRVAMSDLFFQWNKVYVIDTNQGPLIKRIKPGIDKEHVSIVSDNPNYDPFELHLSAIHSVALVIGVLRLE